MAGRQVYRPEVPFLQMGFGQVENEIGRSSGADERPDDDPASAGEPLRLLNGPMIQACRQKYRNKGYITRYAAVHSPRNSLSASFSKLSELGLLPPKQVGLR